MALTLVNGTATSGSAVYIAVSPGGGGSWSLTGFNQRLAFSSTGLDNATQSFLSNIPVPSGGTVYTGNTETSVSYSFAQIPGNPNVVASTVSVASTATVSITPMPSTPCVLRWAACANNPGAVGWGLNSASAQDQTGNGVNTSQPAEVRMPVSANQTFYVHSVNSYTVSYSTIALPTTAVVYNGTGTLAASSNASISMPRQVMITAVGTGASGWTTFTYTPGIPGSYGITLKFAVNANETVYIYNSNTSTTEYYGYAGVNLD